MLKKTVWPILLIGSIALSIIFIVGFITSINISQHKDIENIEKETVDNVLVDQDKEVKTPSDILVIGDSIGFGIGDEENLGIGKRYLDLINKEGETELEVTNISVPGYESNELVDLLKSGQNKQDISDASLIIISIGGNDLNRLEYEDDLIKGIVFKEALENYKTNMDFVIKEIRAINEDAQVGLIGLYNPYREEELEKNRLVLEWNYETRLIVNSDFKFAYIPTFDQFKYHLDDYLSADDFHPNALGYKFIAEELYRILN